MRYLRLALLALFTLVGLALASCSGGDGALTIVSANGEHRFAVEVVDTEAARAKGLMFRDHLGEDQGMLFDFRESRPVAFWMQNTLIPLDMLFIRADGVIANIHQNAKPMDTTSIPSDGPVMFVLEIPGGRSAALGLAAGDRVKHPRIKAN